MCKYYSSLGAERVGGFSFSGRKPTRGADRGSAFVKESGMVSGTGNILLHTPPGMRGRKNTEGVVMWYHIARNSGP